MKRRIRAMSTMVSASASTTAMVVSIFIWYLVDEKLDGFEMVGWVGKVVSFRV